MAASGPTRLVSAMREVSRADRTPTIALTRTMTRIVRPSIPSSVTLTRNASVTPSIEECPMTSAIRLWRRR